MKNHVRILFDVYEKNYNLLLKKAVSILGNLHDAEDVLQDLAIIIMEKEYKFIDVRNHKAFLATVLKNLSIDYIRRQTNRPTISGSEYLDKSFVGTTESFTETIENRELLDEILLEFPPEIKEAFVLHVLEGYSIKEIALKMGMEANTLTQKLKRIKVKITQKYLLFTIYLLLFN